MEMPGKEFFENLAHELGFMHASIDITYIDDARIIFGNEDYSIMAYVAIEWPHGAQTYLSCNCRAKDIANEIKMLSTNQCYDELLKNMMQLVNTSNCKVVVSVFASCNESCNEVCIGQHGDSLESMLVNASLCDVANLHRKAMA